MRRTDGGGVGCCSAEDGSGSLGDVTGGSLGGFVSSGGVGRGSDVGDRDG